jgi:hypothetical protein
MFPQAQRHCSAVSQLATDMRVLWLCTGEPLVAVQPTVLHLAPELQFALIVKLCDAVDPSVTLQVLQCFAFMQVAFTQL